MAIVKESPFYYDEDFKMIDANGMDWGIFPSVAACMDAIARMDSRYDDSIADLFAKIAEYNQPQVAAPEIAAAPAPAESQVAAVTIESDLIVAYNLPMGSQVAIYHENYFDGCDYSHKAYVARFADSGMAVTSYFEEFASIVLDLECAFYPHPLIPAQPQQIAFPFFDGDNDLADWFDATYPANIPDPFDNDLGLIDLSYAAHSAAAPAESQVAKIICVLAAAIDWSEDRLAIFSHPVITAVMYFGFLSLAIANIFGK